MDTKAKVHSPFQVNTGPFKLTGSAEPHAEHGAIQPLDQESGSVGPVVPVAAVLGINRFNFSFFNEGGTNNLKPGRQTNQSAGLHVPAGASNAFICLDMVVGEFVTNGGNNLTERPLGAFAVQVFIGAGNTLVCSIMLSDSNADDPIKVLVSGSIVYFR